MSFEHPEVLEVGRGDTMPTSPEARRRRRTLAIGAGVTAGAVALGAAAWGVYSFVSTGPQPAEALPASTLAYAAIDLDPSGPQKIEAYQFLRKFPAVREELDLETDDDLRRTWFEELVDSTGCTSLDYEADVADWLGARAAVAAVDLGGETPAPVMAVQVTDDDAARDGLEKIRECVGSPWASNEGGDFLGEGERPPVEDTLGWAIEGDWAILAASAEEAQQVVDATAAADLADDEEFTSWMAEVGSPGIVTLYAAPEAGQALLDSYGAQLDGLAGMSGDVSAQVATPDFAEEFDQACEDPSSKECDEFMATWDQGVQMTAVEPAEPVQLPAEIEDMFKDFDGAAATVGFDDGALQLSAAGDADLFGVPGGGTGAGALAGNLPSDTVAALAWGVPEDWADRLLDGAAWGFGGRERLVAEAEEELGLVLPDDLDTLLGERVAVALGGPLDDTTFEGQFSDAPLGMVVDGDADKIREVLDRLAQHGTLGPDEQALLEVSAQDDLVALGAHQEWRDALVQDGDLAGSGAYQRVVRQGDDADLVVFVDFDGDNDWASELAGSEEDRENVAPLDAFGASVWTEDGVAHTVWRLTTD